MGVQRYADAIVLTREKDDDERIYSSYCGVDKSFSGNKSHRLIAKDSVRLTTYALGSRKVSP